jgi:hypothetical protein
VGRDADVGGVRGLLDGLRPGMTEREAVGLLGWDGTPLSCHLMLTAGRGRRSACSARRPRRSSAATGSRRVRDLGALNCRAGFVVEDAAELPEAIRDYVDRLVGPYFAAVAEWYGRSASASPAARSRRSSTASSATRSSGSS